MPFQVRRVVTGHNDSGNAVVKTDEVLSAVGRGVGALVTGCEIWSTDRMPVDNSAEAESSQRAGFVYTDRNAELKSNNYVRTGGGVLLRIDEFQAGHPPHRHRTATLDYGIVMSGEIDLDLENDEVVHLKAGDIVVERGTKHNWMNRSAAPCVILAVMIDATPVEVDRQVLGTQYPE